LCVSFENKIPFLRIYNIVLNVKFHFAGELRGFANCVCVFRFCVFCILSENVCKQSRKTVNATAYLSIVSDHVPIL